LLCVYMSVVAARSTVILIVCTEKKERVRKKERKKEKKKNEESEYKFILQYSTLDNYDLWPTCMCARNIILSKDSRRFIVNNNHN